MMDAKSKANFINSIADGHIISCPNCGAENKNYNKYCVSCGTELVQLTDNKEKTSVADDVAKTAVKYKEKTSVADDVAKTAVKYVEPSNIFAEGLPSWDIVPPQVMVRRH